MGLFDKLFNQGAKVLKQVASEVMENVADEVLSGSHGAENTGNISVSKTSAQQENIVVSRDGMDESDVYKKLRLVLANEFPGYEVREQVSPTTLGGAGKFRPYDFGVYENGVPKLFIMVVYNNTCAQREYRWSKEEAEKAGVPMINFVFAFENRVNYVIDRLHQYL